MAETLLKNRVRMTSAVTGTGTATLVSSVVGYASFEAIGNANECYYTIVHDTLDEWEVGLGVYTSSGTTLTRTTVFASSNSGSLVDFTAGTKDVFVAVPAHILRRLISTAKTTTYTAKPGDLVLCDVSGGSFTVTLPAAPLKDEQVAILLETASGANMVTVDRNGKNIDGAASNVLLWQSRDVLLLQYDGAEWLTVGSKVATREVLSASRTYYVRTDGSDSNTGLGDSSGGAFLTIQKAINVVAALDLSIYSVTIQVRSGTYTGGVAVSGPWLGTGTVTLTGDTTTPANVIISKTSGDCISANNKGRLTVSGFKLQTTTSGHCLAARNGSSITISGAMNYGAAAAQFQMYATGFGSIICAGITWTISGGAAAHFYCDTGGYIQPQSSTVTLTGTPAFSNQFAHADTLGIIYGPGVSFSGAATGIRYAVTSNSVINTGSGGATYFPGDVAGSATTGGQYL